MPDSAEDSQLITRAQDVLANNYRGGHTIPAEGLYPHQWLWDSCFIAIGLRHYDVKRAQTEVLNLLRSQWSNGMIPHMTFDLGLAHRQDRELWRSYTSPYSPDGIATSGITQPPLIAEAVVQIGKKLSKAERILWFKKTYPSLLKYHQWFYTDRDPTHEGLVSLFHPWETGLDSTPPWTSELHANHMVWWIKLANHAKADAFINFLRRDTRFVPPGERLSSTDALLLYNALRKMRRFGYSTQKIISSRLPAIEDVGFNAILVRNNQHIKNIAKTIQKVLPKSLEGSFARAEKALEELWDEHTEYYFSCNRKTGQLIRIPSVSSLLILYSRAVSKDRAHVVARALSDSRTFGLKYPVPSMPKNSEWFDAHRYWQGPTWINTNWLLADGLAHYGLKDEAKNIRSVSLELVKKHGFYEYFSPIDGSPAGAQNFSWTAALTIDLLKNL